MRTNQLTARIRQKNTEFMESLKEYPWVLEHKPRDRDSWYPFDATHPIFRQEHGHVLERVEEGWLGPVYQQRRRLKLDDALMCMVNYVRAAAYAIVRGTQFQVRNEITGEVIPWDAMGE